MSLTQKPLKGRDYTGISVSFYLYRTDGRILVHRRGGGARDEAGTWDVGGGGLKWNEHLKDGVSREVMEEFGVVPDRTLLLGFREIFRTQDGVSTHWINFKFACRTLTPELVRICEPDKCAEMRWIDYDEITTLSPLHSQVLPDITRYGEELRRVLGEGR